MTGSTSEYLVDVRDEFGLDPQIKSVLREAAVATLRHQRVAVDIEVTVLVTDDDELGRLNKEFLDIDSPTDVLSFPSGENFADNALVYLGDIAVSIPAAEQQAQQAGHPFEDELQMLIVHAMLHLLGYDHASTKEKKAMWSAQEAILSSLGIRFFIPNEENK